MDEGLQWHQWEEFCDILLVSLRPPQKWRKKKLPRTERWQGGNDREDPTREELRALRMLVSTLWKWWSTEPGWMGRERGWGREGKREDQRAGKIESRESPKVGLGGMSFRVRCPGRKENAAVGDCWAGEVLSDENLQTASMARGCQQEVRGTEV